MFKLYRKSQEAQLRWIRKHPIQWIAYNVIASGAFIGFIEWRDRREWRQLQDKINQTA